MSVNTKITELTTAKDYLERGISLLKLAGYTDYNRDFASLVSGINGIKADIIGLQTGKYPYVEVIKK